MYRSEDWRVRWTTNLTWCPFALPMNLAIMHFFSTVGKKIKWMRKNPKVCLQVDEIENWSNWYSVVVMELTWN